MKDRSYKELGKLYGKCRQRGDGLPLILSLPEISLLRFLQYSFQPH